MPLRSAELTSGLPYFWRRYCSLTHSIRETARIFSVSPNTVYLLNQLFIETGSLEPRECPHLITPEGEIYLKILLSEEVDLTLEELRSRYAEVYGVQVIRANLSTNTLIMNNLRPAPYKHPIIEKQLLAMFVAYVFWAAHRLPL